MDDIFFKLVSLNLFLLYKLMYKVNYVPICRCIKMYEIWKKKTASVCILVCIFFLHQSCYIQNSSPYTFYHCVYLSNCVPGDPVLENKSFRSKLKLHQFFLFTCKLVCINQKSPLQGMNIYPRCMMHSSYTFRQDVN